MIEPLWVKAGTILTFVMVMSLGIGSIFMLVPVMPPDPPATEQHASYTTYVRAGVRISTVTHEGRKFAVAIGSTGVAMVEVKDDEVK